MITRSQEVHMKRLVLFFVILFFIIGITGSGAELKFSGFAQAWFSYAQQDTGDNDAGYGFTLRRVRFKPYGTFSEKIQWTLQFGWDKFSAQLIDAYIDFNLSKELGFRVGHFTVPGAMSGTLTSSHKLDMLERPQITENWGSNSGLQQFRALGLQAQGKLADDKLYYAVMFGNAKGSSIFTPSIKSADYSLQNYGHMAWARVETFFLKGLRIGAFLGESKEIDTEIKRSSYGAHFYYIDKGINFKAEYIAGKFGIEGAETKYNGMYAQLGYKIKKLEPIVRFDIYTPNDGNPDGDGVEKYNNFTLGINYFHDENIKFQVNYVFRDESMAGGLEKIKNNLFYVCLQFTY
jgi:phosphate-selective porin